MNAIHGRCPSCLQETNEFPCPICKWQEGVDNSPPFLSLGAILNGNYRIAKVLGHGGFGITYLAWDENLHQRLAIKEYFPRDSATRAPDGTSLSVYTGPTQGFFEYGLERFLEEARILARFEQQPGIVRTKSFFSSNLTGYMVMEFVDGFILKQYLEKCPGKRIPFDRALDILTPVMTALQAVHKENLLHRDVAPDNIYITKDKQIKLLDFGAARFASSEQSKSLSVILKPGYAPEEQYRSKGKQGPWTDVYAMAATMYRAITGFVPPEALDRLDKDELIPPSRRGVGILPEKEAILLKALAVRASDRFQTMSAFQNALRGEGLQINTPYKTPIGVASFTETDDKQSTRAEPPIYAEQPVRQEVAKAPESAVIVRNRPRHRNRNNWTLPLLSVLALLVITGSVLLLMKARSERHRAPIPLEPLPDAGVFFPVEQFGAPPVVEKFGATPIEDTPTVGGDTKAIEPELVDIPTGCYQMGNTPTADNYKNNTRPHKVCVETFKLARYEVTNREFRRFRPEHNSMDYNGNTLNDEDQPVVWVNWQDAISYAQWLSGQTGKLYRLPTEAEWEYAARAGTTTARFWGDNPDDACTYANTSDQTSKFINAVEGYTDANYHNCADKHAVTAPVGNYQANDWQAHDMLGNVWEWTCSAYNSSYDGSEKICANEPSQVQFVAVRGGSWSSGPRETRVTYRKDETPSYSADGLGFRLVRVID